MDSSALLRSASSWLVLTRERGEPPGPRVFAGLLCLRSVIV